MPKPHRSRAVRTARRWERMAAAHDDRSSIHPSRTLFGSPSSRARRLGTVGRGFAERVLRLVGHFGRGNGWKQIDWIYKDSKGSLFGLTQKSPNRVARCRSCARELSLRRNESLNMPTQAPTSVCSRRVDRRDRDAPPLDEDRASRSHLRRLLLLRFDREGCSKRLEPR
jgi:hypothetical protein